MRIITPKNAHLFPEVNFVWKSSEDDISSDDTVENNKIYIGNHVLFRKSCTIYWGVKLGNEVIVSHYAVIRENTIIGDQSKIGSNSTLDGYIEIGRNVSIHSNCFVANKTKINDNVFIGPGCTITNVRKIKHGRTIPLIEESTIIQKAARIGGGCTLLPGINIGQESLVGAGSVVTKSVPSYKVVIGVPAKIFDDVPENEYLQ